MKTYVVVAAGLTAVTCMAELGQASGVTAQVRDG